MTCPKTSKTLTTFARRKAQRRKEKAKLRQKMQNAKRDTLNRMEALMWSCMTATVQERQTRMREAMYKEAYKKKKRASNVQWRVRKHSNNVRRIPKNVSRSNRHIYTNKDMRM